MALSDLTAAQRAKRRALWEEGVEVASSIISTRYSNLSSSSSSSSESSSSSSSSTSSSSSSGS